MSNELVPLLSDAIRRYYGGREIKQLCELCDVELTIDGPPTRQPDYFNLAKRLTI